MLDFLTSSRDTASAKSFIDAHQNSKDFQMLHEAPVAAAQRNLRSTACASVKRESKSVQAVQRKGFS